jgi:hypothetical protein
MKGATEEKFMREEFPDEYARIANE